MMTVLNGAAAPGMAAAAQADNVGKHRLIAVLREVREELAHVRGAADGQAGAGIPTLAEIMSRETSGIQRRLDAAGDIITHNEELAEAYSDALTRICNLWDDLQAKWRAGQNAPLVANAFVVQLDEMIAQIGVLTVPPRVNENLDVLRVGNVMDFNREFKDEIPAPEGRTRILSWMNDHPATVHGVVDLAAGTITMASAKAWRRAMSWLMLVLVIAAVIAVAALSTGWVAKLGLGKVPQAGDREYVLAVVFAYLGAAFHLCVAALKQVRGAATLPERRFTALGNIGIWVHVHETAMLLYAFAIPVASYALILATGTISLVTVFFVGYSIDSVLDVLLARFDTSAKKQSELVTDALNKLRK